MSSKGRRPLLRGSDVTTSQQVLCVCVCNRTCECWEKSDWWGQKWPAPKSVPCQERNYSESKSHRRPHYSKSSHSRSNIAFLLNLEGPDGSRPAPATKKKSRFDRRSYWLWLTGWQLRAQLINNCSALGITLAQNQTSCLLRKNVVV